MTTLSASLRLRPTRIGFLVSPTDMEAIRRILQLSTCLWGGFYNPIIPVSGTIPDVWKARYFSDPDGLRLANSVPAYAGGAYATVLALRVFARTLGMGIGDTKLTYATGLNFGLENEKPFEVDFTLWYQRGHLLDYTEEPALVFGEAKSFAVGSFQAKDITRMRKLAEKFPGAFLVFATLKDALAAHEKAEITALATWGREQLDDGRPRAPVIVLTGIELFTEWRIEQTWKALNDKRSQLAALPALRLDNLWTLADLTQQVYLDLPDRFAALRAARSASHPKALEEGQPSP